MGIKVSILIICMAAAVACSGDTGSADVESLLVTDGTEEQHYSVKDLEELTAEQAAFEGTTYVGVPLSVLLVHAGYDPTTVAAVKATASDGFTVNYDQELANRSDTLVAYATEDGSLSEDDGTFRMVLPDQEGNQNPRHLVELKIFR